MAYADKVFAPFARLHGANILLRYNCPPPTSEGYGWLKINSPLKLYDQGMVLLAAICLGSLRLLRVRNRLAKSFEEHQSVLDSLRDGDGDGAVNAIRSHVMVQGERFNDLLAGLSQLEAQVQRAEAAPLASTAAACAGWRRSFWKTPTLSCAPCCCTPPMRKTSS